ncbi:ferredoxin [Actinocorallia sp. B10E7]|uniref:ferredoxin n=1 Tax=Actinocorallia sp. B10E7 TaxID=3153558 RepID=UPI00325D7818
MSDSFRVEVDHSVCAGHGRCYDLAPSVFEPDDDGFATVTGTSFGTDVLPELTAARRNCPEQAITVTPLEG